MQVVPILRAGLILMEQAATLLPVTQTYHVGYVRDDQTLEVRADAALHTAVQAAHAHLPYALMVTSAVVLPAACVKEARAPTPNMLPVPLTKRCDRLPCFLQATCYLNKLPPSFSPEDRILVSDPMLATGKPGVDGCCHTAAWACCNAWCLSARTTIELGVRTSLGMRDLPSVMHWKGQEQLGGLQCVRCKLNFLP